MKRLEPIARKYRVWSEGSFAAVLRGGYSRKTDAIEAMKTAARSSAHMFRVRVISNTGEVVSVLPKDGA